MIDLFKTAVVGQFHAALSMLKSTVDQCPEDQWGCRVGEFPLWQVAYHALFYADLYLSPDEASYEPFTRCWQHYQFFGRLPWPPYEEVKAEVPVPRGDVLAYIEHCRQKAIEMVAAETAESLAGPPGFWWYKIPRAEFHLNNIRHIQHHAAQMSLALRRAAGVDVQWVATG